MAEEAYIPGFSILAFNKADENAFRLVYDKFYTSILFFARSITQQSAVAEDITVDTFVKLWSRCARFDSLSRIKSFLYIVAANASRDYLKVERRRSQILQAMPDQQNHFEEEARLGMIREEILRDIATAIESLPGQCRTIMKMAYIEGRKPSEISQQLNLSVSTIRNQQARGIILLRAKLSGRHIAVLIALFLKQLL